MVSSNSFICKYLPPDDFAGDDFSFQDTQGHSKNLQYPEYTEHYLACATWSFQNTK